jgi:curved DNA-binding protein CbpA
MNKLEEYYKVLGLEPGASLEEVNQAYKDLAFIWHPDRIPKDNPRLQQKAEAKLKEINQAREELRSQRSKPQNTTPQSKPPSAYSYQRPPRPYYQSAPPARPTSSSQSHYQTRSPYPDMSGADFRGADLKEKDFSGRNLSNANFTQANLSDAFLHRVNLQGAILERANLFRANLLEANLSNANLREANLIGADFSGANLSGADLTGAKIGFDDKIMVKFTGALLSGTILPDGRVHQ